MFLTVANAFQRDNTTRPANQLLGQNKKRQQTSSQLNKELAGRNKC